MFFSYSKISVAPIRKWRNHLWQLSPELCALAFFNKNVLLVTNTNMAADLAKYITDVNNDIPKKYDFDSVTLS